MLILGGTTEASEIAAACADAGIDAILSYAGRVAQPRPQPVETRIGGFGGAQGLADWIVAHGVMRLVDATHPFAARISANAVEAARLAAVPLIACDREPWTETAGDRWRRVADMEAAVAALAGPPRNVFLAIGRLNLEAFAAQPQHRYLLRLVDAPAEPLPLPHCTVVVDRGPFNVEGDAALFREHAIDCVVAKNAGGTGASAKLEAARMCGAEVVMIARPGVPARRIARTPAEVMAWLAQDADLGV